jgi:uncharacterized LabA/DUF88 family protein
MKRAVALIDGFNFYHPIKNHQKSRKECLQWLDYSSLLRYYSERVRNIEKHTLEQIYFFSALAKHRNKKDPHTTGRHLVYINALKHSGVTVLLGEFKRKTKTYFKNDCVYKPQAEKSCTFQLESWEEKETDVRIACKFLELAVNDTFDICYLLSADSDLVPAIETLRILYPSKQVILVTPPSKVKIDKLKSLCAEHIKVGVSDIKTHQFNDEITTLNGYTLKNPWVTP